MELMSKGYPELSIALSSQAEKALIQSSLRQMAKEKERLGRNQFADLVHAKLDLQKGLYLSKHDAK